MCKRIYTWIGETMQQAFAHYENFSSIRQVNTCLFIQVMSEAGSGQFAQMTVDQPSVW